MKDILAIGVALVRGIEDELCSSSRRLLIQGDIS
jgi:hypothetical protein